jgi:Family of unknown function (DUF6499)
MSEDETWRSETAYDYIDKLDPGDLAWEFLRRNPDYRSAYQELLVQGQPPTDTSTRFAHQWGLRFRSRSKLQGTQPTDLLDRTRQPWRNHRHARYLANKRPPHHR